jgi:hypothetical protein
MSDKTEKVNKTEDAAYPSQLPELKKGAYSDGHPLDDVQYLECKIILKGDRFTSVDSFHEFAKFVKKAAEESGVDFSTKGFKDAVPQMREVLFLDTVDFKLYNNAFILRRRTPYRFGFLNGDPEIVFKYRHPELQASAAMDVRPQLINNYKIKFKAEMLPLKNDIGGVRMLYSHNVEFSRSQIHEGDGNAIATLGKIFPPLHALKMEGADRVELVNQTAVAEVLLDLGILDFGKGITAGANIAVWRTRGDEKQLVGEFAYQIKFQRRDDLHAAAMKRNEQFFVSLQLAAQDWLALGTTKTGAVYRLKGNPPQSHE